VVSPDEAGGGGHCERTVAADPSGVRPHDQCRGGDDRPDSDQLEQIGAHCGDELVDLGLVGVSFGPQVADPSGEGLHG